MADKTAAQAMIDLLVDGWGVRDIFGLPGDGINGLTEALRKRKDDVRFIQVRHEEAAAFAATGYAKFSGRLGVCIATSGPGAIHLLNGLYDARMDQQPVLAITGLQFHDLLGNFYQQDVDTDRLMADVALYSQRVMGPAHVESVTNIAVRTALGRRGVAHIAFPADLQIEPMSAAKYSHMNQPGHTAPGWQRPRTVPEEADLARAAEILNTGKRVMILAGSGARGATTELEQLAETLAAPVTKALLGKDILPDDSPYTTGGIGPLGTRATQDAIQRADTLLILGSSFPYVAYLPKPGSVRAVQLDLNPERIGLRYPVELGLTGDTAATLRALLPLLHRKADRSFLESAQAGMRAWREVIERRATSDELPMNPQAVARALSDRLADDAIVCGDSGANTFYAARAIDMRGQRRFSVSGLLASMACGLPYAIGAAAAFPGRQVVTFTGDGGFSMLMAEVATCVKYNLPVKVVVLKNNVLGLIRWEQMMYGGNPEYGVELADIDYAKVAEACGATGLHVERPDDLAVAIDQLLSAPGVALLDAVVDPFEPAISGSIKPDEAEKIAQALTQDSTHRDRIHQRMVQAAHEDVPANRDTILKAMEQVPATDDATHATGHAQEPAASHEAQRVRAAERHSG